MSHGKFHPDEGNVQKVIVLKEDEDGMFSPRDVVGVESGSIQDVHIVSSDVSLGGGGGLAGSVSIQDGVNPLNKLSIDGSGRFNVLVANLPQTQAVSGTVNVGNFPATQAVSGTVSVSNHPSSVAVSNFPATQPVSGTVTVSNPTANPETGLAKDVTAQAIRDRIPAALDADGGLKVHVQNPSSGGGGGEVALDAASLAALETVSVNNFPATQTVSGTVSVANFPATQPVSGTVTANTGLSPLTDVQLRAAAVPVSLASVPTHTVNLGGPVTSLGLTPSTLGVTATGASGAAVTLTLPAVAGQFIYINQLEISLYSAAARTGAAAPITVTTTNLPGTVAFTFPTAGAIGTIDRYIPSISEPIRAVTAGTAVTIVCPIATGGIWRLNALYFTSA